MSFSKPISLVLCLAIAAASAVAADSRPFTTAGSAGTVDEADLGIVTLTGPYVSVSAAAAAPSTVDVRYNVVDLEGLHGYDRFIMRVRFLDNGASARVIVRLKEYNIVTGATVTRMTLDSNAFGASGGYQTQSVDSGCWPGWAFNFDANIYFIEVELQKTGAGGSSSLAAIQIGGSLC